MNAKLKDISEIEKTNTIQINKSIGLSEDKKKEIEKYLGERCSYFEMSKNSVTNLIGKFFNSSNNSMLNDMYDSMEIDMKSFHAFFERGSLVYKFNDNFVDDYLNYDFNIDDYLEKSSMKLNHDCFCIYAKNIINSKKYLDKNESDIDYDVCFIHKYKSKIYFIFRKLDDKLLDTNYVIKRNCPDNYNLIDIIQAHDYNPIEKEENNEIIKGIIKLIIYIQSSNVDLRKVSPENPKENNRKERDRSNTNNLKNDSLFEYYNIGYSWQKLPIYIQDQWSVRGHFRLQPCGQNRENHKIIFIEPQVRKRKTFEIEANV